MAGRTLRMPRGTLLGTIIAAALVIAVVVVALLSNGYDARKVNAVSTSVWVVRGSGQYGRVDTALGQLDTVEDADTPNGVAQSGGKAIVYTDGYEKMWSIDAADPKALVEGSSSADASAAGASSVSATASGGAGGATSPAGTRQVLNSGRWAVYLGDAGHVFVQNLTATGTAASPVQVPSPPGSKTNTGYSAAALAVTDDGTVELYSSREHAVRRFDATTGAFVGGKSAVADPPASDAQLIMTAVGDDWALADAAHDRVWVSGHKAPVHVDFGAGAVAGNGVSHGGTAYFADERGLIAVDEGEASARRVATAAGTPAAPTAVGGTVYAAWVSQSGGTLWSSGAGRTRSLAVPNGELAHTSSVAPMIASNGSSAVLDETSSGLLWTIPSGKLIPLSEWSAQDVPHTQEQGVQVADVTQEEPPVAQASSFGVRAGTQTLLPVLLNAYDANKKDVITIAPSSVSGLSKPGFGTLSLTDDDQQLAVDVHAQSGTATFSYAVTDGTERSAPVTVTLHVVPSSQNTAPSWCGIASCTQSWPTADLLPGGTAVVPVMTDWVDPEGDPMVLESAVKDDPKAPIIVVPTTDGSVAVRHTDPNAAGGVFSVTVTVVDSHGAARTKSLRVDVSSDPNLQIRQSAVVASVGQQRAVPVTAEVQGGSGSYRLVNAVVSSTQRNQVSVATNAASGTMTLSASRAGEYLIDVTVQDAQTRTQQSGQFRFSVVANPQALSIPPLTAFVQPNADTTLDVLDSVQNTSGRVLALVSATSSAPGLSASVVGNDQLRVSGSTPSGQPGEIGTATITVSDGSSSSASGQVAVFLAPRATGVAPIAVPDSATVRVGDEIDIPVTANDIAPRGQSLTLSPTVEASHANGELAFVSGDQLRFLAPSKAGTYTVDYSEYFLGDPTQVSTAEVTITVVGASQNHAPDPAALAGRVVAGHTATIPVPSSGNDPDGDTTTLVSIKQPKRGQGSALISADGSSIGYVAPASGVPGGQVTFSYTVADAHGLTGVADVTVAVLGGVNASVTPVTYTDTVQTVTGSAEPVTAQPLLNDTDPSGGTLSLVSVVPNAPDRPGNSEYNRLKGLIDPGTDLAAGTVKLRAGNVQGTQSYIYTVRSSVSSSTAQGLIVVGVTASSPQRAPAVTDTVVTLASRAQLADGIDVVSGKVTWPAGDASKLALSVWGPDAQQYHVDGNRISGPEPAGGALVPFTLTGDDFQGRKTVGHGFLRIPALNDMPVTLSSTLKAFKVDEDSSVDMHVPDAVVVGPDDQVQVKDDTGLPVQRSSAQCAAHGQTATYSAGRGAPWTDTCTVQVRVAGQSRWTSLPLPIAIQPKAPQATLTSVARTIPPGQTQTINLYQSMVGWEGGRVGDASLLDYRVSYSGTDFVVKQNGGTVTVQAKANATSGAIEQANVAVTAYGGLHATIALTVGIAAPDSPRGATFTQSCRVSSGPSCTVQAIGRPGQYDPFQGKPGGGLKLVGIGQVNCAVASVVVAGQSAITATWPSSSKPAGGTCVVPYTVADAQGRTGAGTMTLDVQGYPATPSSISTAGYTGSSVTLHVALGDAANAHPALSGVRIYQDGKPAAASCSPGATGMYTCVVGGLQNGQSHSFTARAVNAVGESGDTTPVVTWAYQAPSIQSITASSITPATRSTGTAQITLSAGDDVAGFRLTTSSGASREVARSGAQTVVDWQLPVGSETVTAVPVSQFQPPSGSGGNTGAAASTSVQVAGTPYFDSNVQLTAVSNSELRFSGGDPNGNSSQKPVSVLYALWQSGDPAPSCSADGNGNPVMSGGTSNPDFTGLEEYTVYYGVACVGNGYGASSSNQATQVTVRNLPGGGGGQYTYTIGTTPTTTTSTVNGTTYTTGFAFTQITDPSVPKPPHNFQTEYHASATNRSATDFDSLISSDAKPGTLSFQDCWNGPTVLGISPGCGAQTTISPTGAPTTASVSVSSSPTGAPVVGDLDFSGSIDAPTDPTSTTTSSSADVAVTITTDADTGTVTYQVDFQGQFASFGTVKLTRPYTPPAASDPAPSS